MEKIDRLGWAAATTITSYGVAIKIRVSHREALDVIRGFLPPHVERAGSRQVDRLYSLLVARPGQNTNVRRFHVLYADTVRIARTLDLDEALRALESDMQLHVAQHARNRIFVHAGVVGWRGSAILIPGSSYAGKSTLVEALLRAGATYYSDEYAILDRQGRVHPYPKPLSIRTDGVDPAGRVQPRASAPGCTGVRPLHVGSIIVTKYRPDGQWRPRALSPGQAGIALLAHTVSARLRPRQVLTVLARAVSGAVVQEGARGEAGEMVASILSRPGERSRPIGAEPTLVRR
jgi:hypothetical protein